MNKNSSSPRTLGILGGGQLGLMLLPAAREFGLLVAMLDPAADAPCAHLADRFAVGNLMDYDTVMAFGRSVDLVTIEIEHVNVKALADLAREGKTVYPTAPHLKTIQNKCWQKEFYRENNIPTADFFIFSQKPAFAEIDFPLPFVHKLATGGYDGRGVNIIRTREDWTSVPDQPGLIEAFVPNAKEISVMVARNPSGQVSCFPAVEMEFHPTANLVEFLFCPSTLTAAQAHRAEEIARKTAEAFAQVGIMAVEMFLTAGGDLLVNECAPRPHNSGHQTIEGNITSQYQQHIRAILDLDLGNTDLISPSVMVNLLGEEGYAGPARYQGLDEVKKIPGVFVHLYGKAETRPFRKMGHVTILGETVEAAREKAIFVKQTLKVVS
ncbi:MAG: 5-(carboxyamino)imidazole ribonucleotide synthase [Bacteroidia bacterium]|nr:5-(carboxyamino)imidazole ribonucleotide synthase [Bacteroidia bacterium]